MTEATVRALIVPADTMQSVEVRTIEPALETLKGVVGGWLEHVGSAVDGDWHAYCDEEGKLKGLPLSLRATRLAWSLGWPRGDVICGPAVFLGNGTEGEEADVPQHVIDMAVEIGCHVEGVKDAEGNA